ncbi:DUF5689 domain-containing protein [Pedobacter sp. ASV1-7]|uniref:DUF5689 domain-containing protein n=1 Tax=Pedobacter sp. ASV1-7 TaxID=3145237 RepID=UPI0032E8F8CE
MTTTVNLNKNGWLLSTILLMAMTILFGCKKSDQVEFSTDIAINNEIVRVADAAGTSRILVFADKDWTLTTENETSWVTFDKTGGNGNGEFIVTYESNKDKLPRSVNLVLSASGKTRTISFQQKGLTPTLNITDATANGIGAGGVMKTAITTNIPFDQMVQKITYTEGTDWISDLKMKDNYLYFTLGQNSSAASRSGKVLFSYKDALGTTVKDSIIVSQNIAGDFANAVLKDFNYLKTTVAAGVISDDIYIEGTIVSDKGNPNIGQNPNKATNKHEIDKTENAITVYIQSNDGTSGVLVRTKTGGDNIFVKNDRVKIWLKGLTLRKEVNPARVILENLESINIMSKVEGTEVTPRSLYIKDLTPNDLYTLVKIKEVEIAVPLGSFSNITEGYVARTDAYPNLLRDINGNSLAMIVNNDVPYRRDGKLVPQGAGDVTGVLVSEKMDRYGANIGDYSIRPLKRADIDLAENRSSGFSNILVEWSRFKKELSAGATLSSNPLTPDIGTGVLTHSASTSLNFTSTGISGASDYNGLIQDPTGAKGLITDAAWSAKNWWNTTQDIGASWNIQVSTLGITKPISLQLDGNSSIGGPRNFVVEWNSTGFSSTSWNALGEYTMQDIVDWTSTLLTQVPGFKVVNFQFPLQASGLDNLYIRLRVKNKVVGSATSPTGGTLGAAGVSRLGHLSIKYNK